ncbi:MAG: hypothetical protein WCE82_07810 [Halobacteriota archaeon]
MDLPQRENDFIICLSDQAESNGSKIIERGELYSLAKKMGFNEREVYRYAMDFDLLGYVTAHPILGGKIASLTLTAQGVNYVKQLRDQQEAL